ncbi:MAG: hypothetical protein ACYS67_06205 [Planctomycetota bacterium]
MYVTPAKEKEKPLLEVFHTDVSIETFLWKAVLGNDYSPEKAFVSNDGEYVVTINECSGRVHGGFGDYVIAFYNKEGLINNYSLEQILHYPDKINEKEFRRLTRRTTSGRSWARKPVFFDSFDNKLIFCAWLTYGQRWLAWDISTGKEIKIEDLMVRRWNKKGRRWALNEIQEKTKYPSIAYEFLGYLKNPEDRRLIETLLSDEKFIQSGRRYRTVRTSSAGSPPIYHLERYYSSSLNRLLAEKILANWDGRPTDRQASFIRPLCYLGKVEGTVSLPKTTNPKEATLWFYLVPASVPKDQWHKKHPIQRLVANFNEYSFRKFDLEFTEKFPFAVSAVTPGKYWIKAVLGKTKPLSKSSDPFYVPRQGDYQSLDSTIITVEAGKTVDNITIDCTHKVTDSIN